MWVERKGGGKKKQFREILQLNRKSIGHSERKSFIDGSSVQYVDLFCTCKTNNNKNYFFKKPWGSQSLSVPKTGSSWHSPSMPCQPSDTNSSTWRLLDTYIIIHFDCGKSREVPDSKRPFTSSYLQGKAPKRGLVCGLRSRPKRSIAKLF